jgi:hypothetical protein
MSSMADVILRLGALLSLPVRRARRVLLHPRGLLFCTDLLVPDSRKVFQSEEPMATFSRLCRSCARVQSLVVERRSSITAASEADGPANSWQLG